MLLAGYFYRYENEVSNEVLLWMPPDGEANSGRKKKKFIDNLFEKS